MHRRSRTRFCRRKSCSLLSRLQLWLRNRWIGTRDTDAAPERSASQTENTNVLSNHQPGDRRDLAHVPDGLRYAVRFAYEWHDDSGNWFRSYGNENWEFDEH